MKKLITSFSLVIFFVNSYATKHVVTNSGQTFTPASITINVGDTVVFQISSFHDVVEVSQATWDANGNTSNGGFSLPFGGGELKFTQTGTFYYVCEPHAANGMKGTITVTDATGIQTFNVLDKFRVTSLPESGTISIFYNLKQSSVMMYSIYKLSGEKVYSKITPKHEVGEVNDILSFGKELPMGVYILEAIVDNRRFTRKLFITPLN